MVHSNVNTRGLTPFVFKPKNDLGRFILSEGWSISRLGKKVGITPPNLREYVNNPRIFKARQLIDLSEALGLSFVELLTLCFPREMKEVNKEDKVDSPFI